MRIYSAPLQGITEYPWRRAHVEVMGGVDSYLTPFMRSERGEVRRKDMREAAPEANAGVPVEPQVLASTEAEMRLVVDTLKAMGYRQVNINLGCPFRPVSKRGHGAGMLARPDDVAAMLRFLSGCYPDIRFSIKTRLGLEKADELAHLLPEIARFKPVYLAIHARTAAEQYGGEADVEAFARTVEIADGVPVVYNGDILTVADAERVAVRFPGLHGIMIGRGLLRRPSLAREIRGGAPYSAAELRRLHEMIYEHYESTLQGDSHLLAKMKPFWEYTPAEIGHRQLKAIAKAGSAARYRAAVADALAF